MHEFKVDFDGDAIEDLTYRATFDEPDSAGDQRFVLRRMAGNDTADPECGRDPVANRRVGLPCSN
jgi:hypothetical protein